MGRGSGLSPQDAGDTGVDVILALVVPFPVDLDELRDLRLSVVELGVVLGVKFNLLARRRVPHGFAPRLLDLRAEDEVDVSIGKFAHLGTGCDVPDLLARAYAFRRRRERNRL